MLTIEANQEELNQLRDIILATIDYSLQKSTDTMKVDGKVPSESYYQKLKQDTEHYFKQKKHDKLKHILSKVLESPIARVDVNFDNYILEKTGYEISIFKDIQESVGNILAQNQIKNEKEFYDATILIRKFEQESPDEIKINVLNNLCRDFNKNRTKTNRLEDRYIPKELSHVKSPNEKFRLIVRENERNGEFGTTTVSINGKGGGASMYDAEGVKLDIKAFWKDDNTVIIESKKEYKILSKFNQIQFFNDIIDVNLIEY